MTNTVGFGTLQSLAEATRPPATEHEAP